MWGMDADIAAWATNTESFLSAARDFALAMGGSVDFGAGMATTICFTHAGATVRIVVSSREEDNEVTVSVQPPREHLFR